MDTGAGRAGRGRCGPGQTEAPAHAAVPGASSAQLDRRSLRHGHRVGVTRPRLRPANGGATDAAQVDPERASAGARQRRARSDSPPQIKAGSRQMTRPSRCASSPLRAELPPYVRPRGPPARTESRGVRRASASSPRRPGRPAVEPAPSSPPHMEDGDPAVRPYGAGGHGRGP
jgi:hypothetical protein